MTELLNEEMYCLVAPDGTPQPATIAPDLQTLVGYNLLLESKGLGQNLGDMLKIGFEIKKVLVTITEQEVKP